MRDIKELSISTKLSHEFKVNQMNFDPKIFLIREDDHILYM